jgi:hypothetical protein
LRQAQSRPAGSKADSQPTRRSTTPFSTGIGSARIANSVATMSTSGKSGALQAMATNTSPLTEVLHSENHSKLSSEQIAKAVARHNKNHSAAKAENIAAKANKGMKK